MITSSFFTCLHNLRLALPAALTYIILFGGAVRKGSKAIIRYMNVFYLIYMLKLRVLVHVKDVDKTNNQNTCIHNLNIQNK